MPQPARILMAEDDQHMALLFKQLLEQHGYDVLTTRTASETLAEAQRTPFDVGLTNLVLADSLQVSDGLELIARLHTAYPQMPVLLFTGCPSLETTVAAIKLGAYDHIFKPVEIEESLARIGKALSSRRWMTERVVLGLTETIQDALIGHTPLMQALFERIRQAAGHEGPVLIRGESGTGKTLVARAIYQHGNRTSRPFAAVNCIGASVTALESELFGHEPGVFKGAAAARIGLLERMSGGTILIKGMGDIWPGTQAKLLSVLQDKTIQRLGGSQKFEVDVRIIASTHRDLEKSVLQGQFNEELYFLLNRQRVCVPPLRAHSDDIPALVKYFERKYHRESGTLQIPVSEGANTSQQRPWLGNVGELENVVRKGMLVARDSVR